MLLSVGSVTPACHQPRISRLIHSHFHSRRSPLYSPTIKAFNPSPVPNRHSAFHSSDSPRAHAYNMYRYPTASVRYRILFFRFSVKPRARSIGYSSQQQCVFTARGNEIPAAARGSFTWKVHYSSMRLCFQNRKVSRAPESEGSSNLGFRTTDS